MSEVYRARDTRLGREVALKILPSNDPDRPRRFELEARAASALNHPNIVTVYDAGMADGVAYLATELVDGAPQRRMSSKRNSSSASNSLTFNDALLSSVLLHQQRLIATPSPVNRTA